MERFGARSRPRTALLGFSPETEVQLGAVVPTLLPISALDAIEQVELDLIVVRGHLVNVMPHVYAIVVAKADMRTVLGQACVPQAGANVFSDRSSSATEFTVPVDLDPRIARLVRTSLIPGLMGENVHNVLSGIAFQLPSAGSKPTFIRPWVIDSSGRVLAGSFQRGEDGAECWCLPSFVEDPTPWAVAARQIWSEKDLARFPLAQEWRYKPQWQTSEERTLSTEAALIASEKEAFLLEVEQRERDVAARLQAALIRADSGDRRLLTGQATELKEAVRAGLTRLGFTAEDMDASGTRGDLLEDLRVSLSSDPTWTSLIEVRGYQNGGAKLIDLMRIGRFKVRYMRETGNLPSEVWYVVNQFASQDPSGRPLAFASNPDELDEFAKADGAVVDSRVLFRLLVDVAEGALSIENARSFLKGARGRVSYD